jgi:hypothetical protein
VHLSALRATCCKPTAPQAGAAALGLGEDFDTTDPSCVASITAIEGLSPCWGDRDREFSPGQGQASTHLTPGAGLWRSWRKGPESKPTLCNACGSRYGWPVCSVFFEVAVNSSATPLCASAARQGTLWMCQVPGEKVFGRLSAGRGPKSEREGWAPKEETPSQQVSRVLSSISPLWSATGSREVTEEVARERAGQVTCRCSTRNFTPPLPNCFGRRPFPHCDTWRSGPTPLRLASPR